MASMYAAMPERDENYTRLVEILLLEAGQIMEDASPDFAMAFSDIEVVRARIDRLDRITGELNALAAAARTLLRHVGPD